MIFHKKETEKIELEARPGSDQSNVSPSLDHLTLPTAVFVHDQVDNPVDFMVHL